MKTAEQNNTQITGKAEITDSLDALAQSDNYDAMRRYAVTMTNENQRLQRAMNCAIDILNSYHHVKALGKACDMLTDALQPNVADVPHNKGE